jgi:DNA-directed RNA polymerase subunit RPC12/RpoP
LGTWRIIEMAVFKCKMCGGSLEVTEGMTVCECEYCGTKQTIPKSHDDVLTNNFNRANNLRMKNEFDKAQELYEKIVSANPTEAEAYWGIVLCKYGIEYVEDPTTLKKIPTCHRTQYESVVSDVDYHSAIENADAGQKELFEKEAAEIDKLQKNILELYIRKSPLMSSSATRKQMKMAKERLIALLRTISTIS